MARGNRDPMWVMSRRCPIAIDISAMRPTIISSLNLVKRSNKVWLNRRARFVEDRPPELDFGDKKEFV